MRLTTSALDISRLKMATPCCWSTATLRAMLSAKAVLPMEGRAARMMRFDGWKPPTIVSRSRNPVWHPVVRCPSVMSRSSSEKLSVISSPMGSNSPATRLSEMANTICSARSMSSTGVLLPPVAHLGDLAADLDERAQVVVLPDDLRVVAGVGGRGDGRHQAVDERAAPHRLQAGPVGQLLRDGDGVDRFSPGEQVFDDLEDALVPLPVEVVRPDDLTDGRDDVGGEHARPQHGQLRVEVLWKRVVGPRAVRRSPPLPTAISRTSLALVLLRDHDDFDLSRFRAAVDVDLDHVRAHHLDGVVEVHITLVDADLASRVDGRGDVALVMEPNSFSPPPTGAGMVRTVLPSMSRISSARSSSRRA